MIDPVWVEKLSALVQRDMTLRQVLLERGVLNDGYHPDMEKVHIENARRLQKLIDKMGFPVLSNAGEQGVRLAWLIIQHAIALPDFMREGLTQMRLAAGQSDWPLDLLAYTEDQVAFFEGRLQIYGTHKDWQDLELKPTPILEPQKVDIRRRSMGLPPLKEALWGQSEERPPKDIEKLKKEYADWVVRVGWQLKAP
jgi:hypothetical protein